MRRLITSLSRSAFLRRLVKSLRLHSLGNAWLRRFPFLRRLPESGVIYRATRLESIPLSVEMFEKASLYDASLLPAGFSTFIDLGCNVGYFTCWLAHLARGRKLRGLMVDANADAVAEARWHAQANGLADVHGLHGIVGEKGEGGVATFYVYESNICSSSQPPDDPNLKGKWEKVQVPCIQVEASWRERFGQTRCDLLKVDIEGSELQFLQAESGFLDSVDALLIEWHKWRVQLPEIETFLHGRGFVRVRILDENETMGTAFFRRETPR
jgi:FkbM family methyltransferase